VLRLFVILPFATSAMLIASLMSAEEPQVAPRSLYPLNSLVCPNAILRGCCCVYCPKPVPCVRYLCCCCPNDYCSKPLPCLPCYLGGCCDCYCRKPCPCLCRPIATDYFSCDAGSNCGTCTPVRLRSVTQPGGMVESSSNALQAYSGPEHAVIPLPFAK
jgi:hypothetical protein